jgi:hypothetical protein
MLYEAPEVPGQEKEPMRWVIQTNIPEIVYNWTILHVVKLC